MDITAETSIAAKFRAVRIDWLRTGKQQSLLNVERPACLSYVGKPTLSPLDGNFRTSPNVFGARAV